MQLLWPGQAPEGASPEMPPATLAPGNPRLPRPAELAQPGSEAAPPRPAALPFSWPPGWYLHVFPQRAGMRVGLVTHLAQIGLIGGVDVHVLLSVAAVCEAPVAALKLTLERLLPCRPQTWALAVDTQSPPPTLEGTRHLPGSKRGKKCLGPLSRSGPLCGRTKMKLTAFPT